MTFRSALQDGTDLVEALFQALGLTPGKRYEMGILRTSVRSKRVLDKQTDTGVNVYAHHADFQTMGELIDAIDTDPAWVTIRFCDLVPGAGRGTVGYLGLVGSTVFLCVHDSAIEGTLPPFPGDVAKVGRNAFTELALTVAICGQVTDIYAPNRERWWREDNNGQRLLKGFILNLPNLRIWDGLREVDTSARGAVTEAVNGASASYGASASKEASLEKQLTFLRDGKWPRASCHLPLPLRRVPTDTGGVSRDVEIVASEAAAVTELLTMLAKGATYAEIGRVAARLGVRVPGPKGATLTFADLDDAAPGVRAKALFTPTALAYWKTGKWTQRLTTNLTVDKVGGHELDYDPVTRRRYMDTVCDKFPYPDDRFGITKKQWRQITDRLATEEAGRHRRRGRAVQKRGLTSAFSGVARWTVGIAEDRTEFLFAPETPTAYRLRTRKPERRGARNREGKAVATFRKVLFDRAAGHALLDRLHDLVGNLSAEPPVVVEDDALTREAQVVNELEEKLAQAEQAAERWERKFEREKNEDEAQRADEKAKENRATARRTGAALDAARAALDLAQSNTPELVVEDVGARLSLPVLVGDALASSDGTVACEVRDGLSRMHVLDTITAAADDPKDPTSWWTFTAVASVTLIDESRLDVPFSWRIKSSLGTTGVTDTLVPMLVTGWMTGRSFEQLGTELGQEPKALHKMLNAALQRAGVNNRGRRAAAVHCPIADTRTAIAARVLDPCSNASSPWAEHVVASYWTQDRWGSFWCLERLEEGRRILSELTSAGRKGLDVDAISRRIDLPRARVRSVVRMHGIADLNGRRLRPHLCAHQGCNGLLTHWLPTPETGRDGLICHACWRTAGGSLVPAAYMQDWVQLGGHVMVKDTVVSGGRISEDDRLLTIGEVADLTGVKEWVLRAAADARELRTVRGPGPRGGIRLFREQDMVKLNNAKLDELRCRSRQDDQANQLHSAEAAALLGTTPHRLRPLERLHPTIVSRDAAGRKLWDADQLRALPNHIVSGLAAELVRIGDVARATRQSVPTVQTLTNAGLVPVTISASGHARYDLVAAIDAIEGLGLEPDETLVAITDAAGALGTTVSVLRARSNKGEIPPTCVVGGKRRYALSALTKVRQARADDA
jgi:hypothetical protein